MNTSENKMPNREMKLIRVEPQPGYIESSGRWRWPLPEHARYPGCCTEVVTASREWWEYAPSEARPHPMAEGVRLRDDFWYWAVPNNMENTELKASCDLLMVSDHLAASLDSELYSAVAHALAGYDVDIDGCERVVENVRRVINFEEHLIAIKNSQGIR